MMQTSPTVLVTGVAGNLGVRLLPLVRGRRVIGIDMQPPADNGMLEHFEKLDLGVEASCARMVQLLREYKVQAVIHLAFIVDPLRAGVLDTDRMWQSNVAGTARVMEAIAEVNRQGGAISKFIFLSSVSAYGPDTPPLVKEDHPLGARTLHYALHKQECDEVVQFRAPKLGACTTYILRPHIFVGATVNNYLVGSLRGTPLGKGRLAARARKKRTRLPFLLPRGRAYLDKKIQFVHVDDMARLIAFLLDDPERKPRTEIMNVAGSGEALTIQHCASIADAKILRLPTRVLCRMVLRVMWDIGLSGVPPEAFPYIVGSYTMDTSRLRALLGDRYKQVMQYSIEEGLADTFQQSTETPELKEKVAARN